MAPAFFGNASKHTDCCQACSPDCPELRMLGHGNFAPNLSRSRPRNGCPKPAVRQCWDWASATRFARGRSEFGLVRPGPGSGPRPLKILHAGRPRQTHRRWESWLRYSGSKFLFFRRSQPRAAENPVPKPAAIPRIASAAPSTLPIWATKSKAWAWTRLVKPG